jgi:hypothetical protein
MAGKGVAVAASIVAIVAVTLTAQARREPSTTGSDLYGVWDFKTLTPLQRPDGVKGPRFTKEEMKDFLAPFANIEETRGRPDGKGGLTNGNYPRGYMDEGDTLIDGNRSSLIVDPLDGRIPYTPDARKRMAAARAAAMRPTGDDPEDLGLNTRCMVGINAGPPLTPLSYNNVILIIPGRGRVVLMTEMIHTARVVRMNTRAHVPSTIRTWSGDSIGWWEGDALVVETTNFNGKARFQGASEKMRVIEKFRRTGADTVTYEYTVDDPATFTRPWTARFPMLRSPKGIFEYACHEGNYTMANALRGARAAEKNPHE